MSLKFVYQNISPRLEEILKSIDRPGDFCTFGRVSEPMPRLEVENVGILSFPVPKAQIEELIQTAAPAPYGKGSQTLVDASVRNCWEVNIDRLSVGGQSWAKTIRRLRRLAANGLGCPSKQLNAQLYKLLIYPTGGYFVPHRDTEKSDGMIATLTISLPVEGTGGDLVVQHKDREMTVEMNVNDPSELAYAAFYADCEHEIKKVRSGHRIALVYNLCLEHGDTETFRTAPDYTAELDEIVEELRVWCKKENTVNKLVWILDHGYSQAGLSFSTLKNGDRALANALKLACEQVECELYASIVNMYESYIAFPVYGGSYDYYEEPVPSEYEIDELIESATWMDSWVSLDGSHPKFGEMSINEYEPMPKGVLDNAVPDDERIEEATGNAGTTLERAYHSAALVLFRRDGILDELVERGGGAGVAWITEELSRNEETVDDRIIRLADSLTKVWPVFDYDHRRQQESISEMLLLLVKLNSRRTSTQFLREIAVRNYKGSLNDELVTILSTLDPPYTEDILRSLICKNFSIYPKEILQMLMLLDRKMMASTCATQKIFAMCAGEILNLLPETLSQMTKRQQHPKFFSKPKQFKFRKGAIKNLVMLFWRAEAMDDLLSVTEVLENFPVSASLDREVPKALVELQKVGGIVSSDAYSSLWRASARYLLDRSGTLPEPPKDWKISFNISCRCPHCNALRKFCENPEQSVARFPLRKDLRAHLHQKIDAKRLDLSHVTERKGRPFTLVCTKNRATYKRRLKQYAKDIHYMNSLIQMITSTELTAQYAELQIAIEHSRQLV